ncbi:alkaline phosphatase family protein [Methylocella tundrae]|uniref:alkaline phosphatase family protein n=1 Tax=Methylocella tundrae TaxID=227605 RepID=UPI0030FE7E8E|nr:alkaline phosphatase family protein [Methylocella tundrae]
MKRRAAGLALLMSCVANGGFAAEGVTPTGIPHLDHVYVIMMENHGYSQILNNPNAPFTNRLALAANHATNYFAVGHPSFTNYLEVVGGSNFGVQSDNAPNWHNTTCTANLASHVPATDNPPSPTICPIAGEGVDAATPVIDTTNETQGLPGDINIDGHLSFPAASHTFGKTIADQLVARRLTWKSYQENLPASGADQVNTSDGVFTNNTDFSKILPTLNPPLTSSNMVALYAVKHNPFAYFKNVQEGYDPNNSLQNMAGFDGARGLFADLGAGASPNFSFIAPNQCNDQHGQGNAGALCNYDPSDVGLQSGLNPALIQRGDVALQTLVTAIHQSPAWRRGNNAIVIVWDENDYSTAPNTNQVLLIVDTNYGAAGVKSSRFYTHFSLLKTLEAGFGLPCLNHACDSNAAVMSDLFAAGHNRGHDHDHDHDDHDHDRY